MRMGSILGFGVLGVLGISAGMATAQQLSPVDRSTTGLHVPFGAPLACQKGEPTQGFASGRGNTACLFAPMVARGRDASAGSQ